MNVPDDGKIDRSRPGPQTIEYIPITISLQMPLTGQFDPELFGLQTVLKAWEVACAGLDGRGVSPGAKARMSAWLQSYLADDVRGVSP